MKKTSTLLVTLGIIIGTLNLGALAANSSFSDGGSFASWFESSANKMQYNNVMTGYPDGSFQGTNAVNRAELAVILDRFSKNVVGKELAEEPIACTMQFQTGLVIKLQDQHGKPILGAKIKALSLSQEFSDGGDGYYSGLEEQEGYFDVTIAKQGYITYAETIKLEKDECHVITQKRTITLITQES